MRVIEVATNTKFCVSMVYAVNDLKGRHELWDQLTTFATHVTEPWLVCGDFNCVLSYAERLRSSTSDQEIDEFQNFYSRLDRALINEEWSKGMPDIYSHFLPEETFDHTPCILKSSGQCGTQSKPFKYFNMWGKAASYLPLLSRWWDQHIQGTKMYKVVQKLKSLKHQFRRYNKDYFSDIENNTGIALKNLENIQSQIAANPGKIFRMKKEQAATAEYRELHGACTQFLSQKAKAAWIKDGDYYYKDLLGIEVVTEHVNAHIIRTGKTCTDAH
ncbi:uncharacterized protein LOC141617219 [Silene latifolia]|uniref:uncharacterized protein LOC141617219 n=1 Tax=Silene latifolia TaxID=37657 RepID=UPI003D77F669